MRTSASKYCLFRFGHGSILPSQHVRPEPAINDRLVWPKSILSQAKAGMEKGLIVFACNIEILNQSQQGGAIKIREVRLYIRPPGL
jgi:hypothetical protein